MKKESLLTKVVLETSAIIRQINKKLASELGKQPPFMTQNKTERRYIK